MASPTYEGRLLPTSSPAEGEAVDDVFEGRLETTIKMRIGETRTRLSNVCEAAFALQRPRLFVFSRRGEMFIRCFGRKAEGSVHQGVLRSGRNVPHGRDREDAEVKRATYLNARVW